MNKNRTNELPSKMIKQLIDYNTEWLHSLRIDKQDPIQQSLGVDSINQQIILLEIELIELNKELLIAQQRERDNIKEEHSRLRPKQYESSNSIRPSFNFWEEANSFIKTIIDSEANKKIDEFIENSRFNDNEARLFREYLKGAFCVRAFKKKQ